jgi:hypothetical protein
MFWLLVLGHYTRYSRYLLNIVGLGCGFILITYVPVSGANMSKTF